MTVEDIEPRLDMTAEATDALLKQTCEFCGGPVIVLGFGRPPDSARTLAGSWHGSGNRPRTFVTRPLTTLTTWPPRRPSSRPHPRTPEVVTKVAHEPPQPVCEVISGDQAPDVEAVSDDLVVPDSKSPGMYRVRLLNGVSDMVNLTRASEAARMLVVRASRERAAA